MSYHWKKSNLRVVIDSDLSKDRSEVLDLSDNRLSDKFEDHIRMNSDLMNMSHTHDSDQHEEDDSKNGDIDINDSDQNKPSKRNPKCARCANHLREPVAVKGHKRKCFYKDCVCRLCNLTVERRELMAKTIREKRKQKEDLADNSYVYNEPIFKKQRTDESSSETDRESGYGTEENEKSKPNDPELDEELKKHGDNVCVRQMVSNIWNQLLDSKLPFSEIGQTLLTLYLKDNIISIVKQNISPNSITNAIIEASKQITFSGLSVISPMPLTPLTPTTPSKLSLFSPPSSASSTGSSDSPNDSLRLNSSLFAPNFPLFPHYISPLMAPYIQKSPWFASPMAPIPNHQRLSGL